MTDRVRTLIVVLDRDYRDDDVQSIVDAIGMIKGVAGVESEVATCQEQMAREIAKDELRSELLADLAEKLRPGWTKQR